MSIQVTQAAWAKMREILHISKNKYGFVYSATSGGCNGFNFDLGLLDKDFYEKIILNHKREYGYIWGIDAYTLEDTPLGVSLNQRATGMIGNKINLSFIPSDNVNIVWTKIGNFEIMEPFTVHFNEPGRFNAINFDYKEKSIFFETIENQGTVTFSGAIKNVLVDSQNYTNFNGNVF